MLPEVGRSQGKGAEMQHSPMSPYLTAGALAGVAGLLAFLIIHHYLILPIWFILPLGLLIAILGGLAVGWCYFEIRESLPPRPWAILAIGVLFALILAPSIVIAELRPSFVDPATGTISRVGRPSLLGRFVVELILTTILAGAVAGWLVGRTSRAAVSMAVAGVILAIGPGHNLPFLANTPGLGKGILLLGGVILVSSPVLVEGTAWLTGRSRLSRANEPGT